MTTAQAEHLVRVGVHSLEVRWIFPARPDTAVAGWFERFRDGVETREDAYLVNPWLQGLSVKIRGGGALEMKVYHGSPGNLQVAGRACGRMESWQKWSFPGWRLSQDGAASAEWVPVHKRISRISPATGQMRAHVAGPGEDARCVVELTEVHTRGEAWWTVGFEATGPTSLLRRELEATAWAVVLQALPDDMELDIDHAQSYAEWLSRRP